MGKVLELAERLWSGTDTTATLHPFTQLLGLEPIQDGLGFVSSFANVNVLATSEGLVLLDAGSFFLAGSNFSNVREWSRERVHTAVYTHGHVDHAFGLGPFEEEARAQGWDPIRVVAHHAVNQRFDRYALTAGYNEIINRRQFGTAMWPTRYRRPDLTFHDRLELAVGGEAIQLFHDRGETDDHAWAFLPERRVLCTGDLFIWASPNCGNPQKVQRYPLDWARALRRMAELRAVALLPGHGPPILGEDRVHQALSETAELLETLVEQTLGLMNAGKRLDAVIHGVHAPAHLLERPYLRPIYDDPAFVVRNLWRLYGGWWDGNPAHLKPAPEVDVARELAALAGGAERLAERARALLGDGRLQLASHLVEHAALAAPGEEAIRRLRGEIYAARAEEEPSLMAKGIFGAAARGD
ncbi:MAG: MBL fold metallo-hydrolase [Polyangiaceae bacterium]|nr:MBL fold metallo-hydrolase [Polyangiaceae bacterium]